MARSAVAAALKVRYLSVEQKQNLLHRINRARGQVAALGRMIDKEACVDDLLIQLAAAKSALNQVALKLVEEHLVDCSRTCMEGTQEQIIRRITRALAAAFRGA
jgi:DNA-binding FrmR family transcriptional regulator